MNLLQSLQLYLDLVLELDVSLRLLPNPSQSMCNNFWQSLQNIIERSGCRHEQYISSPMDFCTLLRTLRGELGKRSIIVFSKQLSKCRRIAEPSTNSHDTGSKPRESSVANAIAYTPQS